MRSVRATLIKGVLLSWEAIPNKEHSSNNWLPKNPNMTFGLIILLF